MPAWTVGIIFLGGVLAFCFIYLLFATHAQALTELHEVHNPKQKLPDVPKYCYVCGKPLIVNEYNIVHDERTGKAHRIVWFSCPDYKGGVWMTPHPKSFIAYRADFYDETAEKWYDLPSIGYTRYQTCNKTIMYR